MQGASVRTLHQVARIVARVCGPPAGWREQTRLHAGRKKAPSRVRCVGGWLEPDVFVVITAPRYPFLWCRCESAACASPKGGSCGRQRAGQTSRGRGVVGAEVGGRRSAVVSHVFHPVTVLGCANNALHRDFPTTTTPPTTPTTRHSSGLFSCLFAC